MSHLDYYKFQAQARGVKTLADVERMANQKGYVYDRIVLPWLPSNKSESIAELACGHGSFLSWLKTKNFSQIAGVDSSVDQIQLARQVGAKVYESDVNQWLSAQPSESQQALVGIDLAEHLSKDNFLELVRLAHKTLAPGGSLILRLPNGDSPLVGRNLFNDITHVWTYTPNCLRSLAEMTGYSSAEFVDESSAAIRDHRWIKVPLSRLATALLRILFWTATRERIDSWSPHLWARFQK